MMIFNVPKPPVPANVPANVSVVETAGVTVKVAAVPVLLFSIVPLPLMVASDCALPFKSNVPLTVRLVALGIVQFALPSFKVAPVATAVDPV